MVLFCIGTVGTFENLYLFFSALYPVLFSVSIAASENKHYPALKRCWERHPKPQESGVISDAHFEMLLFLKANNQNK